MSKNQWDPQAYVTHASFVSELGKPTLALLDPQPSEHILDIGCGDGTLTKMIADANAYPIGIDANINMVESTRAKGIKAYHLDATNFSFDQKFDAVFSNAALHWVKDHNSMLSNTAKVIKKNGRFVAEFGGIGNVASIISAIDTVLNKYNIEYTNPWYFPDPENYKLKLSQFGFNTKYITTYSRPTRLNTTLTDWLNTFGDDFFIKVPESDKHSIIDEISRLAANTLYRDKKWYADYVRIQFIAHFDGN
jgi:2-isopropylmalate synthase